MVLLLDNYDSFTYNLFHYLVAAGVSCEVKRNDEITAEEVAMKQYSGVVLSPGPGIPAQAGKLMDVLRTVKDTPVLGICLGHQAIGVHFGAVLEKACRPMHGKISTIGICKHPMFEGVNQSTIEVVRYHSLIVKHVPESLEITSTSVEEGVVMAFAHKKLPQWGLQFHPEAALTQFGHQLIRNWVNHFSLSQK